MKYGCAPLQRSKIKVNLYVWKDRRESGDPWWYEERSHAPLTCPHTASADIVRGITAMRERPAGCLQSRMEVALLDNYGREGLPVA